MGHQAELIVYVSKMQVVAIYKNVSFIIYEQNASEHSQKYKKSSWYDIMALFILMYGFDAVICYFSIVYVSYIIWAISMGEVAYPCHIFLVLTVTITSRWQAMFENLSFLQGVPKSE